MVVRKVPSYGGESFLTGRGQQRRAPAGALDEILRRLAAADVVKMVRLR